MSPSQRAGGRHVALRTQEPGLEPRIRSSAGGRLPTLLPFTQVPRFSYLVTAAPENTVLLTAVQFRFSPRVSRLVLHLGKFSSLGAVIPGVCPEVSVCFVRFGVQGTMHLG